MLTEVKKHLKLLINYFSLNLQSSMEYKTNFLIQTFGMMINNVTFILFWWVLFNRMGQEIGGYHFKQLLVIWAITSSGFGFSQVLFGNAMRITRLIINGNLDTYLLQPKNVLWNLLISRTNVSAWGDLFYGIILFAFAVNFSYTNWVLFLFFIISAGCLFTAVMVFANTLTFFVGRANIISSLIPEFAVTLSIYPEGIFKGVIRFLIYTLLPAGFISYIPVRLIESFNPAYLTYLILFDFLFISLSFYFFKLGLREYESGNLVQSKV